MTGEGRTGWDCPGEGEGVVPDGAAPNQRPTEGFFRFIGLPSTGFISLLADPCLLSFVLRPRQAVRVFCARCEVCLLHFNRLHKGGLGLKGITGVCGTGRGEVGLLGLDRSLWEFRLREAEG